MPYCPKCRDEFQDWVKVCPDCGVAMVEKLPPLPAKTKQEKRDEELVHIATAPNEAIANIWAAALEEHGIRCLVKGANLRAAMYFLPFNMQCEIHVLASEAKRAKEILDPFLEVEG